MVICLCVDPRRVRGWHQALAARLGATLVGTAAAEDASTDRVDALLRWEGRLRGRPHEAVLGLVACDLPRQTRASDLAIDLVGDGNVGAGGRTWHIRADGAPGEGGLFTAVARGRCPIVEVREGERVLAAGRLGTESHGLLIESLEDAAARTATLIEAALAKRGPPRPVGRPAPASPLTRGDAARIAAGIAARRLGRRLERLLYRTPHWRVGWRKLAGPDLFALRRHPDGGWQDLPDDGTRFYADPFPLEHAGRTTLFVEDYPHATRRGLISAVQFGPDGPVGRPEPVLKRPYHLSYPFVFVRDDEAWMVPESSQAATIDLYRATRFPGGWVKEATLVSGLAAGDATLHETAEGWWLFATVKDGGASSDALHLWSAPDFRGPWTPHPKNPVLVDIAAARPAGRMVERGGSLYRPVQDCREGYGAALGFARVGRLDAEGYAQVLEAVLTPGERWPGTCLHTVNAAGGFEFVDGSGRAPRFRKT